MIRDPMLTQQAIYMYRTYLLSFSMDDIIDCKILSFDDWVIKNKIFEEYWNK
jgi:hypothetical protein